MIVFAPSLLVSLPSCNMIHGVIPTHFSHICLLLTLFVSRGERMRGTALHRLDPKSAEAVWVGRYFHLMPPAHGKLLSVYRLQCGHAAHKFITTRSAIWHHRLDKTKPVREALLWHGCSSLTALEQILGTGFRPIYSQRPGAINALG